MKKAILDGVEDTLFIPLMGRAYISSRFPKYFYDEQALELVAQLPPNAIAEKSSEYTMLASVARYFAMDKIAQSFLEHNPNAAVVNLGVGLETMHHRLQSYGGHFYQVDFSTVIQSRQQLLGQAENETLIACNITDFSWAEQTPKDKPVLLVVSGVFQYFKPEAISAFLKQAKETFKQAELLFDATDEKGIQYAQKYVKKTGNQSAMMYFYINDAKAFCQAEQVDLILERGFFAEARKQLKGLKLYTKIAMKVVEDKKRVKLLHVRL